MPIESNSTSLSHCGYLQRFRPMSLEKPKVLLPLVGVPMINYTLEWLASNKVAKASAPLLQLHPSQRLRLFELSEDPRQADAWCCVANSCL